MCSAVGVEEKAGERGASFPTGDTVKLASAAAAAVGPFAGVAVAVVSEVAGAALGAMAFWFRPRDCWRDWI